MENQNDQVLVTRKTFLTGGQRAGYLFAGLLGGAGCAILASLCNMDAPYRSDCTKFALRRGPFSHGWMEGKAGREEEGVTVTGMAVQWVRRLVRMGDE